ncbi:hypothetical protein B0H15DRAFT_850504 [Mycena belliarum]|uniref:DUF6533 domain-containing protein n=1 Tax=Mycena belliarum TaxID=1033014 RepID=A0AAD6U0H9_9AGAR|nr:hypothetical protein B0H15DRAFT_850504 [Mycena belliae]
MSASSAMEEIARDLLLTRYTGAAGLTILLYDHLLSLADERRLIWSAKFTSSKFLFLAMRYIVPGMMITQSVQLAGLSNVSLTDKFCKIWMSLAVIVAWVTFAINNWLVLLRLWVLWDRNRTVIICTLLLFISTQATTLVLAWLRVAEMLPTLLFNRPLQLCSLSAPSDIGYMWLPGLSFEFVMLVALGYEVLSRPRTLAGLQRDGYGYFLCLFALSLANTIIFLVARLSLAFSAFFFTWCFATTTTCRMILNLRRSSESQPHPHHEADPSEAVDEPDAQFSQSGHRPAQVIKLGLIPRNDESNSHHSTNSTLVQERE